MKSTKFFVNCITVFAIIFPHIDFAQQSQNWRLEKMPVDLEADYALSSLPPHLRHDATVYLLDPEKGYYVFQQGSNGYICFVSRTEWEWDEFRDDICTAISYDAEGARSIFPVYIDVAAMRSTGKYSAIQIRDSIIFRIQTGVYKAPSKPGISYMLAPVMRVIPGNPPKVKVPITVTMPHYMLYAPYLAEENARFRQGTDGLMLGNPDNAILGDGKGPHGYVIIPATEKEKAIIIEDGKELIKRLASYKSYFVSLPDSSHAHHH
jgi:hypothetical protein